MITREQFLDLLKTQVETNAMYGVEWSHNSIRCAIYREWGEFLDEVEAQWHCYKPNPKYDRVAAIYELVDISHFMLVLMLLNKTPEELAKDPNFPKSITSVPTMDGVEWMFTEFMPSPTPWYYVHFMERACAMLGISTETYMKAHYRKNERNRVRARAGVVDGKYDKSTETPLTLEF